MNISKEILDKIEELPVLSKSATLLLNIINKKEHTLDDIKVVIENDPALVVKIIKAVNSPYFGLTTKITSLDRAISYLGDRNILSFALNETNKAVFRKSLEGYGSYENEFWEHSLKTAIYAKELTPFMIKEEINPNLAYTCGIIHDIGKSVVSYFLLDKIDDILNKINTINETYIEAENEAIGTNHCEIGYYIAKKWKLPEVFQEVLLNHHTPSLSSELYKSLCYLIHISDCLSMIIGTCTNNDCLHYRIDADYKKYFFISEKNLDEVIFKVELEFKKIKECFNID